MLHERRLGQVRSQPFRHDRSQRRVFRQRREVGSDERFLRLELALGHQRPHGADAQQGSKDTAKGDRERNADPSESRPVKRDLNLEALAGLLEGEMTALIECYRADDIMTALRLIDEFGLEAVLVGASEGYKVASEIAEREVPVIVSPIGVGPRRMETQEASYTNAAILHRAGVKVVIKADEELGIGQVRELPLIAAFAVKGGIERDLALRALTLTAAEVLGVSDRIGGLEPGKDADIVLFDGDPLHYRSRVRRVFIDGVEVGGVQE